MASASLQHDDWLFGWDVTPGIVSVWANRDGRVVVWRRVQGRVVAESARYRPWLFATHLADLAHLGPALQRVDSPVTTEAAFNYAELEGSPYSFRFLVTASSSRALEQTILNGAARRLNRPIHSLYDLADYYRVGPVEQYLMQTGRTYFRGLAYADLHRLQLDLETTDLDAAKGRIFLVALRDNRGLAVTLEAAEPADEPRLILQLCALIRERDPDVIENHNLFGFDLPFLEQRAAILGVPLLLGRAGAPQQLERYQDPTRRRSSGRPRIRYSIAGRECIDTLDAVRRHDFVSRELPSYRLKDAARAFGIATRQRVYIAGADVYSTYQQNPEQVRRYALDDVAEVDGLSQRLMGATFALAGMAPRRYERLGAAGPAMGILEPMLVRAYLHAGAALPRSSDVADPELGPHTGGALYLFATGVARNVVKADIASLYPSLMRTYKIGPACDQLGVLLHLVDRLTALRLQHKDLLRTTDASHAGHHAAMQAAMKLIINSAYGYLGAGTMALFADRRAADEVTRRGRAILEQVITALRARGVTLIEADTDGVFFSVPAGWSDMQERALVAEVAATLPDGIRLEYEGRYQAMLSHEVKNYALLTYDGTLIMRGVALRSSRSEPFGEQFLRQALPYVLVGDTVGLGEVYQSMVDAIRARGLPTSAFAMRARLSKTPEAYRASRSRQREAPYEALLAAGRTEWVPGERVRCYRAEGGISTWLPDEADEAARDSDAVTPNHPDRRDYDVEHYLQVLVTTYAGRLRKAFAPEDFDQIFRQDRQLGLFDRPLNQIQPLWIDPGQEHYSRGQGSGARGQE